MSTDTSASLLPKGWEYQELRELVDVLDSMRRPINSKERLDRTGTVPYFGATGQVGTIDKALFDEDLVLLGEDGVQFFDVDKYKAYEISGPSWVNNHAHVLRCKNDFYRQRLLVYFLNQFDYRNYANGTTRLKLTQAAMNRIPVVVPPMQEQIKIVEILEEQISRLDAAIVSVRAVRKKAARFRRSLLHAAFTGVLTGAESENSISDVRTSLFADLFDLVSNERRQVKQRDYKNSGRFPVVDQGEEIVGGFIDDGDLLFDGPLPVIVFGDHTRRLKFIDFPFVVGADGTKLISCKKSVLPRYGFYHLEAAEFRNRGYARHLGELKKVMFWLPSIQQQEKIVEVLDEQFSRLEASLAVADAIEKRTLALRRSLLHAAFTGELTKEWREGAHV
jgi:type I restriction enzyme S subunit